MMENNCLGNCEECLKVNYSLFSELSKIELRILNTNRKKFNYSKGQLIYQEGEKIKGLLCLNEGKVKLTRKGKIEDEFIISLHKIVDFIGFDDLMNEGVCSTSAVAIEDVSICMIDKDQFVEVIKNNSELALKIIHNQSKKTIQYRDRLINISQNNMHSRLAFALMQLIEFYGFEKDNKTIAVYLKRKEIAAIANMNTANVIREISLLKSKKIIQTRGRKIMVLNKAKLENLTKQE